MNLEPGASIGRYTVAPRLGIGGMGGLFLAEDALLRRRVALKALTGEIAADAGRRAQAEQYIGTIRKIQSRGYVRTCLLPCIYAGLGDKDKAFAEMERSYQDRDAFLPRANVVPLTDPLRDDPRFSDLMRRIGREGRQ